MATEKRLIDSNKLIRDLKGIKDMLVAAGDPFLASVMNRAISCVENQPVVDAVEVVHGRWEFSHTTTVEKYDVVKCSNCGHEAFAIAIYVRDGHYCPNCGTKMDGERRTDG